LVDGLFNTMMTIGFGLFLIVEGALVIAAFRFRRREGDEGDGEHLEGNIPLEIVWTAIPAVVVLGISIYSFDIYSRMGGLDLMNHSMAPAKAAPAQTQPAETKSVEVAYVPKLGQMPLLSQADSLSDDTSTGDMSDNTGLPEGEMVGEAGLGIMPDMEDQQMLSVNVQGMQYAFIFNYPNGIVDGELHIPVNQPVELNLNAQDVLHAFWLSKT
jgi:cytochrome c oxidase subunit II